MILVYTPKITNRVQYIARTILHDICGFESVVTNSGEEFLNFKGAKINYSEKEMPVDCITIFPCGLLGEKGIRNISPMVENGALFPMIFPLKNQSEKCDLGFDLFAASFFMISRYEEYLPFQEDRFGRFEADQSIACQKGFLELPVVDIWAMHLKWLICDLFPFQSHYKRKFFYLPTYDIDVAFAYKGKGITRNIFLFARDLLTLRWKIIKERFLVLNGKIADPFDTYDYQLYLQKKYNLHPIYFFHCGRFGPRDKTISVHSVEFEKLVKRIGDYSSCGIHPSFMSNIRENRLADEINILTGLLNQGIDKSRQHYLKLRFPVTYQRLTKHNITSDFTMGYASHIGFRAGTCSVFSFYDISTETETRLKIYPLAIMDGTLKDYMRLNPADALEKSKKIIDSIVNVGGCVITLWHNDTLSETGTWKGWRAVYEKMIEYIKSKTEKDYDQKQNRIKSEN